MPAAKLPANANNPDQIIDDVKSLAIKEKVMARQKSSSLLKSISTGAMYLGTLLTTATAGVVLGGVLKGGGMAALGAAMTAPVVGALALGAAIIGVAIATDYMASRIWQSCTFDNLEANAESTARHLVKEMKGNNMCLTNGASEPCASDKPPEWARKILEENAHKQALQQQGAVR